MKKVIRSLFMAFIAMSTVVGLNAQDKKATFGVKGGMNVSNFTGDVQGADAKIGFNVGVTLDYALGSEAFLLSGLEFNSKGIKAGGGDVTMNLLYLQLPVHFGYKVAINESTKILFHAGPYLAYGIGGKTSGKDEDGIEVKGNSFSTGGFKEFDFGLGLGVGAEFGKIGLNVGYDFGMINIADSNEFSLKNGNFYVGVGYKF